MACPNSYALAWNWGPVYRGARKTGIVLSKKLKILKLEFRKIKSSENCSQSFETKIEILIRKRHSLKL